MENTRHNNPTLKFHSCAADHEGKELSLLDGCKNVLFRHTLHLAISIYLLIESNPALAFSQVFTGKLGELRNGLILIGKACVGVSLVLALFKFLTSQGGNWKWIGSICAVGCALIGINVLIQFMGGS